MAEDNHTIILAIGRVEGQVQALQTTAESLKTDIINSSESIRRDMHHDIDTLKTDIDQRIKRIHERIQRNEDRFADLPTTARARTNNLIQAGIALVALAALLHTVL